MTVGFQTEAERECLSAFPKEISAEDLFAFFALTGSNPFLIPAGARPPPQSSPLAPTWRWGWP